MPHVDWRSESLDQNESGESGCCSLPRRLSGGKANVEFGVENWNSKLEGKMTSTTYGVAVISFM
jgi:hypothetical protein